MKASNQRPFLRSVTVGLAAVAAVAACTTGEGPQGERRPEDGRQLGPEQEQDQTQPEDRRQEGPGQEQDQQSPEDQRQQGPEQERSQLHLVGKLNY